MSRTSGDAVALQKSRLERYENHTATMMVALAVVYVAVYALEILVTSLPSAGQLVIELASNTIWILFILDLVIRVILAPRRLQYLLRHPIDVVAVAVPMFRFLRILRVITAGQWLVSRGKHLAYGRTAAALLVAVSFLTLVGGLAILDEERGAACATIEDFGDAVWWTFTTMSTVGYGDMYLVTTAGRVVAVGMMTVGVSLLGVISATLAAGFLARTQVDQESENASVLAEIRRLEARLATLTGALNSAVSGSQPLSLESDNVTTTPAQ